MARNIEQVRSLVCSRRGANGLRDCVVVQADDKQQTVKDVEHILFNAATGVEVGGAFDRRGQDSVSLGTQPFPERVPRERLFTCTVVEPGEQFGPVSFDGRFIQCLTARPKPRK